METCLQPCATCCPCVELRPPFWLLAGDTCPARTPFCALAGSLAIQVATDTVWRCVCTAYVSVLRRLGRPKIAGRAPSACSTSSGRSAREWIENECANPSGIRACAQRLVPPSAAGRRLGRRRMLRSCVCTACVPRLRVVCETCTLRPVDVAKDELSEIQRRMRKHEDYKNTNELFNTEAPIHCRVERCVSSHVSDVVPSCGARRAMSLAKQMGNLQLTPQGTAETYCQA